LQLEPWPFGTGIAKAKTVKDEQEVEAIDQTAYVTFVDGLPGVPQRSPMYLTEIVELGFGFLLLQELQLPSRS